MEKERPVDPRRAELGAFLRGRRAALSPENVGLPSGPRRRTPGLRREEVAERAEISVALYTWLEQGRDVPVSRRSIDAIATALRLSPAEHRHLHILALQEEADFREEISPALRRLVTSFRRYPVFVLNHAWDVVLRNAAAQEVFRRTDAPDARFNLLESVFEDEHYREIFIDYDEILESVLAMFRLDYPALTDDPRVVDLVERLRAANPAFARLWLRYNVQAHPEGVRRLKHPVAGDISLEPSLLAVAESPGLRLMIYRPADDDTACRIERLVAARQRIAAI